MIVCCCLWVLVGCGRESAKQVPAPTEDPNRSVAVQLAEPKAVEVALEEADEARLAEIIADHHGKVILVDYWALW